MIKLKILYLTVLLFSLLMLPVKLQAAERYTVKASIFVPAGWQISPDLLEQQKKDILVGLKEVQTAYQQKLSGKTFNFENQIGVVFSDPRPSPTYSPNPQPTPPPETNASDIFYRAGGSQFFPDQDGIINVIWIVGSGDQIESAFQIAYPGTEGGLAFMNHQDILNLTNSGNAKRDQTLAILAHELGHAFGLVFDGWANGHPCSEISPDECLKSAPLPLPPREEYLNAIMGYHLAGLSGSNFNNSTHNPEICKIFDSPFINPNHDACPAKTVPSLSDQITEIMAISPLQVNPGEIVEVSGRGFGERGGVLFYNPYSFYNPYNPQYLYAQEILKWTDESIRVRVPSNLYPATVWKIRLTDNKGWTKITSEQSLTINSANSDTLSTLMITADIQVSCGKDRKVISGVNLTLVRASDPKVILSEVITDQEGKASLAYTVKGAQPNDVYLIVPPFLEDAYPPQPDPISLTVPPASFGEDISWSMRASPYYYRCPASLGDQLGAPLPVPSALSTPSSSFIPEENITGDTAFYYASPTPEPLPTGTTEPQGGLPQPPETPAASPQEMQITQVTLSNYDDFRLYNDPADQGSTTTTILNPETPRKLTWTLSTISSSRTIYVREIYSDGTYQEYQYDNLGNGQIVYAGNLEINIKLIKRAVKITIGDKEIDIENPQIPLDLHLPGTEGQGQQFKIPVVITYSDGSTLYTALTFNYNPPPPTPAPVTRTCPYQEDPQGCPYGGTRSCTGIYRDDSCVYDQSGQVPPDCRETCNPAPPSGGGGSGNTCVYTESFNCTGQNGGCGGGSGEMRKTVINTDCRESSITYCDGACALSGGGGSGASCPESYPECRGANTFWITPECDDGNIINYKAEDLGNLGQCQ